MILILSIVLHLSFQMLGYLRFLRVSSKPFVSVLIRRFCFLIHSPMPFSLPRFVRVLTNPVYENFGSVDVNSITPTAPNGHL